MLAASVSVARVRPRTSKGITDLLLPQTSAGFENADSPSKKSAALGPPLVLPNSEKRKKKKREGPPRRD